MLAVEAAAARPSHGSGTYGEGVEQVIATPQGPGRFRRKPRPRLRGWLHAVTFPLAIAAGIVLVAGAGSGRARAGAAIFGTSTVILFGTSAAYHRGHWTPRIDRLLKRWDHSNIFLVIAGTYTPFALVLLTRSQATHLLLIVWGGAVVGAAFRVAWVGAPRWLYTPIYVALGWAGVFYFVPLLDAGGLAVAALLAGGGLLYTLGALVYGTRWPNLWPAWFGFHEIFHACTVLAFAAHYTAASLAIYDAPALT